MDLSLKEKIIIGVIAFLIVITPITAFIISYRFRAQTQASANLDTKSLEKLKSEGIVQPKEVPDTSPLQDLQTLLATASGQTTSSSDSTNSISQVNFGPVLNFALKLQGRPDSNQSAKVFVGLVSGQISNTPKYLLTFSVDVPASGQYTGLSLAGLTVGSTYSAVIKGSSHLAKAVNFTMKPAITDLGTVSLLSGDLNDDNIVNTTDHSLAKASYGTTSASPNWSSLADLNTDGVINNLDLAIISSNIGKTGDTGSWISTTKPIASQSAALNVTPSIGTPEVSATNKEDGLVKIDSEGGFWLWVPR